MSTNAQPQPPEITPAQAFNILTQAVAHKTLTLCLEEHQLVQRALFVLKQLIPVPNVETTSN